MHYIAAARDASGAASQKDIFGFRCARDAAETDAASENGALQEKDRCPLCNGAFVPFDLEEIKIPEKNIHTWVGYFDID